MDESFIRSRLTELRLKKGVSEYKMSIDLGHSKGYVQSITSGRALPSLSEFLYICEYLDVTPGFFFHEKISDPALAQKIIQAAASLSEEDLQLLFLLVDRLRRHASSKI